MFSRTAWASCLRESWPARYEARAKWKADEPSMSVLSRSKKAAPEPVRSAAMYFEDDRVALASAGADRGHAEPAAPPPQLVHERAEHARAGCADRMAKSNRSAVDVHLRLVEAEHAHRVDRNRREGLVELEQVDVVHGQAGLLEGGLGRVRRRARQVREVVGHSCLSDHSRQHLATVRLRPLVARDDQRPGTIVDARRVARRMRALLAGETRQLRERLQRRLTARSLVGLDDRLALARLDRHRHDLLGQAALVD